MSQRTCDGADRDRGSLEQGDLLAAMVGPRPGLGPAWRPLVQDRIGEPGRPRCYRARRGGPDQPPGAAHFFGFLLVGVVEAEGDGLELGVGVGAGLGPTALAPFANP